MSTAIRLGLYGVALAVVFAGAFVAADAVVPESTVSEWTETAKGHEMSPGSTGHSAQDRDGGHGGHAGEAQSKASVRGVTSAESGYLLTPLAGPDRVGDAGRLSFRILDSRGDAVLRYATSHERKLHLIAVRTDGTQFRHVHPTMDEGGTWSLPWAWAAAGTYRLFADFVPAGEGEAEPLTLTRTVEVAGEFTPAPAAPSKTASVDGFTVQLTGDLIAGSSSGLTLSVLRDGEPVTRLQPYLGAFGHLVALREGDLAYLHVHPEGQEPAAGELSGPEIEFVAEAPTPGRYLLYLDLKVDGHVRTASFVIDTDRTARPSTTGDVDRSGSSEGSGAGTDSEPGDGHSH